MSENKLQIWLVVGSQHLYGPKVLDQVRVNSSEMVDFLNQQPEIPLEVILNKVVSSDDEIYQLCLDANQNPSCVGIITWMHTFSPAKMWIRGLSILSKPLAHLHTQFNQEIPWNVIDMDYMNLHQSAHGDREFGHLLVRMGITHKILVGHWKSPFIVNKIGNWARVAKAWSAWQGLKVARIGDNMREVAVTEGDKVAAQLKFGCAVNGFGVGDLVEVVDSMQESDVNALLEQYYQLYEVPDQENPSLKEAARIELGLKSFLEQGGFKAFTTTFENLHGLHQLPGISVQRLMNERYGFGAEGDWKTACLLRLFKVLDEDLVGGSSFMEDYTYHWDNQQSLVLGAHMLEICPSIAAGKPSCEVQPLSIGGKEAPARLIFDVAPGPAINVCLVDLGDRFRLVVNKLEVVNTGKSLPKLPVARVIWQPKPNLELSAHAWLLAGGGHHTVFSTAVSVEMVEDLAEMAGIELLIIDENTDIRSFQEKIRWNQASY